MKNSHELTVFTVGAVEPVNTRTIAGVYSIDAGSSVLARIGCTIINV